MLTADEAYAKHIEMWTAMQEALGDNPNPGARSMFKIEWCGRHDRGYIYCHCYLCQYVNERGLSCDNCPIDWGNDQKSCIGEHVSYRSSPLSEILALPRREVSES